MLNQKRKAAYTAILEEELIPAMGCTEPIAIAYAGALARKILGAMPDMVELTVSGNIIKNVKSVIVPHTHGRKGIPCAVAAGICIGDPDQKLEVLAHVNDDQLTEMDRFLKTTKITIKESDAPCPFDIQVLVHHEEDNAYVRIIDSHTNVVSMRHGEQVLVDRPISDQGISVSSNRQLLNVEDIVAYADTVDVNEVRAVLQRQIDVNMAIAQEGMNEKYGANIGKILLHAYGTGVQNRAKAYAAAGSDARMNGCEMPVVINSGSGNQGMTTSIPVIIYAQECHASQEQLYRALIVSNLVTIHLKNGIGSLSAYCGATSAGAGAGAGVCYLYGGRYREIAHTIVNALAINSGMLCDGAKASCAAKIASAVEAGLLGMQMYMHDSEFYCGEGLVAKNVEETIRAFSTIAREGMRSTDSEIIHFMIHGDMVKS